MAEPSVLVTRPAGQARELGEKLVQAGFRPVYAPMMEIEVFDELAPEQRQLVQDLDHYRHIIFVSRNAIRHGMHWIENYWPQLPVSLHWYTVGSASAAALAAYGVEVLEPQGEMTSEGLLARPELTSVDGQRVLIVKGEGGRQQLAETLRQRGATVDELVVYRRGRPGYAPGELSQRIEDCEYILLSSGEGLDNMVSLLGEGALSSLRRRALVVPGERVAAAARQRGFDRVIVAASATDDAMLDALRAERGTG